MGLTAEQGAIGVGILVLLVVCVIGFLVWRRKKGDSAALSSVPKGCTPCGDTAKYCPTPDNCVVACPRGISTRVLMGKPGASIPPGTPMLLSSYRLPKYDPKSSGLQGWWVRQGIPPGGVSSCPVTMGG